MCYKHDYYYRDCGHIRNTIIAPCEAGLDEETEICNANIYQGTMIYVDRPSYCPPCYRKIEEKICDQADEQMADIQDEIRDMQDMLTDAEQKHQEERQKLSPGSEILEAADANYLELDADLQLWIAVSERHERVNRQNRASALSQFRESQGVWGDG